jgi:site-specific DNA recombinase
MTVIYARISKDPEGRQVGVERQEADCRALATRLGLTVDEVFIDNDISASTLSKKKRPRFEEMMILAEGGRIGTILGYSNSRLTRRPLELERLITAHDRTGVQFNTVVSGQDDLSTADGRMVARIKASVDAAESERMGERIRRAKQQARDEGRWHGGWRAFGFQPDGVTPDLAEAAIVAQVCRAILDGRSVASQVRSLNEREIRTSTGKPWSTRTLLRVLKRPNPAVDENAGEAVRLLLDDPARRTTPGPARRWLLSGIARCGICEGPLRGSASSMGPGRGTYPAYRCLGPGKHIVISAITLDEYVSALAVAALSGPDAEPLFTPATVDTTELRREAKALRARLDGLADDLSLDERTLSRRSSALQKRIDEIQAELAASVSTFELAAFNGVDDAVEVWLGLDLEQRRGVVRALMDITIDRGARGVVARKHRWRDDLPAFDPRRVRITWKGLA